MTAATIAAGVGGCSSPTEPRTGYPDFPSSVGSWWNYEVITEQFATNDTTVTVDTISACIADRRLMSDSLTRASVWTFDPYFIDASELRPESLLVTSLGLNMTTVGDTIRMYGSPAMLHPLHTVYLKQFVRPDGPVIYAGPEYCNVSRTRASAPVTVPAGYFGAAYVASTHCSGIRIDSSGQQYARYSSQQLLFFQRTVGFVQIRQIRYDANYEVTLDRIWRLLSYHIEAP